MTTTRIDLSLIQEICNLTGISFASFYKDEERTSTVLGSVVDPDPHGSGTFAWIRIQQKVKEHIHKTVNSGLFVLLDSTGSIE